MKKKIIPNQYNVCKNISKDSLDYMLKLYPEKMTRAKISISTDIENANSKQMALRQIKKSSKSILEFEELTEEIL